MIIDRDRHRMERIIYWVERQSTVRLVLTGFALVALDVFIPLGLANIGILSPEQAVGLGICAGVGMWAAGIMLLCCEAKLDHDESMRRHEEWMRSIRREHVVPVKNFNR